MKILLNRFSHIRELVILVMMLEMLHFAIWLDFGSVVSRSFMLSHLGLFFLWQPVWRGDEKLSLENAILFIVFTSILTIWLNLWLLFAWLILLIGFISGQVNLSGSERKIYLLALGFLVLELLFWCVPELAKVKIEYRQVFNIMLPVLPLLLFLLHRSKSQSIYKVNTVDLIHTITTSMLTSLVALGVLLNMFLSQTSYLIALTQTSLVIGGFILCIGWLLTSQSRFISISQLWSNYMLNIGSPFEEWLSELSKVNERDISADEFLYEAMHKLVNFSWIAGIKWNLNSSINEIGTITKNEIKHENNELLVCIYTFNPASVALKIHSNLLIKLLYNFYLNKKREEELTKQAHLKAIYETGARITHDIKNLLQSLQAITSIIIHDSDDANISVSKQVLKKQLPNLTNRLQLALDKLHTPQIQNKEEIYLKDWWQDLQKRNTHNKLTFQSDIHGDPTVPVDLYDSVVDNLLENALTKRMNEQDIEITITITYINNALSISVCDTGSMIPQEISKNLLESPVQSENGLGIGLYQANKLAEMFGYKLELISNLQGRVCFEFSSK